MLALARTEEDTRTGEIRTGEDTGTGEIQRERQLLVVPVGLSNRYQWMLKAPGEKPGVLDRGQWSRLAGTGCKTGTYGRFRPVLMGCFLVVMLSRKMC